MTGTAARTAAAATAGIAVVFAAAFGVGRLVPPVLPAPAGSPVPITQDGPGMPAATNHPG